MLIVSGFSWGILKKKKKSCQGSLGVIINLADFNLLDLK